MIKSIVIDRTTGNGKYEDVLNVAAWLAKGDLSSAANALAVMARQSATYTAARTEMRKGPRRSRKRRRTA
ncbi:MAG: hypothetical protein V3V96_14725 [Acidiferrobacterales bacterium]